MSTRARSQGVIFLSLLTIMVVVAMLTGALLSASRTGLYQASHYRDGVRSDQAARGGVNHLIGLLEQDNDFHADLSGDLSGATYQVTFDPGQANYSVNNLNSDTASATPSMQGYAVAPHSADLIVTAHCGIAKSVIRVVIHQGVASSRSVAAVGQVTLSGDCRVDGIKSLTPPLGQSEPEPAPGGIFSKYRSSASNDQAIAWTGGGSSNFELGELSRLETAAAQSGGDAVSPELRALFANQIIDQGAADTIPDLDVAAKVTSGLVYPALAPGGSTLTGYTYIDSPRSVAGNLSVNGDLVLSQGALYVDGDLEINGGVKGLGSIFVSGDIVMRGGNTVIQSSQPAGAAMMAGGDISLEGVDAQGQLELLAADEPFTIGPVLTDLKAALEDYQNLNTANQHYSIAWRMTKGTASSLPWVNPIPGPDGRHTMGYSSAIVPRLTSSIKATGRHLTEPRTAKVIRALEEMAFHFRDNDISIDLNDPGAGLLHINDDYTLSSIAGGLLSVSQTELLRSGPFDDLSLPVESRTHSSLLYGAAQPQWSVPRRDAFMANNPLNFHWMGDSAFQGLLYARGSITSDQRFKVVGSLISLGNVTLSNGSTLIFNEEYKDLFGQDLPLSLVHFEQL